MATNEWYEEILELDPESRLFFPFAGQLADEGQVEHSIDVLKKGLKAHPLYTEARILLIHLLYESGQVDEACREAEAVASVLGRYSGFWATMAKMSEAKELKSSLMFSLVEAETRGRGISLDALVRLGLAREMSQPIQTPTKQNQQCISVDSVSENIADSKQIDSDTHKNDVCSTENTIDSEKTTEENISQNGEIRTQSEFSNSEIENCGNPKVGSTDGVSLRTRSMADILADQSDVAGALDIYRELAEANPTDSKIANRIAELEQSAEPNSSASADKNRQSSDMQNQQNARDVKWLLEKLAGRLEVRASEPQQ